MKVQRGSGGGTGRLHRRVVAPIAVTVMLIAACGLDDAGTGADRALERGGTIVLYTSMPTDIVELLEQVFEGAYSEVGGSLWVTPDDRVAAAINLEVVRARTGDLLDRIAAEQAAGTPSADVVWLADPASVEHLKSEGLLARYDQPPGLPISSEYVDPEGYWVAGRVINVILAWNTLLVPDGLNDWPDLLEERHRNRAFPGPGSGSALAAIKALSDQYGEAYISRYAESGGRQVASNGAARDAIVAGDYSSAVVLDYMIRQAQAGGAAVDLAYPEGGTVVIPSPIAVMATAVNPAATEAFIGFVLSRQGQQVLVDIGSFYSVRSDIAPPPGAPPLESLTAIDVDWAELDRERVMFEELWREVFG